MKINYLVLLVIITLNASCQKDNADAIPEVSGIEVPFEEIEMSCINNIEREWVVRSNQELWKEKSFYSDYCRNYRFPEIDFEKYILLGYHTSVGGCGMPIVKHEVFIQRRKLIFRRMITRDGPCEINITTTRQILVPKLYKDFEIEFTEKRDCLGCF